jgi:hypothetical protein
VNQKKKWVSALLVWHMLTLIIDGMPNVSLLQSDLDMWLAPYLNAVGQWQGSLAFFAPEPDSLNLHLEAKITYDDDSVATWRSPDWRKLSLLDKFLGVRMVKFVDTIRLDMNKDAWDSFALYLISLFPRSEHRVKRIEISRHWVDLPPPPEGQLFVPMKNFPHDQSYVFYFKDFPT